MAFRGDRVIDIALVDWGQGKIWCEDTGDNWKMTSGGRCPQRVTDKVIEYREGVTVNKWEDLQQELDRDEHAAQIVRIRETVLKQCDGVMLDLVWEGTVVATVPLVPFVVWSLESTVLSSLAPPWQRVSPTGMYLGNDSAAHSDWWYGAGLGDKGDYYKDLGSPVSRATMRMVSLIQRVVGGFRCAVLVGGDSVFGVVGREIAVVPDLHPDRLEQVLRSSAVVTERGGAVAHLANVARERSIPIIRVDDAVRLFPPGSHLMVNPEKGEVTMSPLRELEDVGDE